MFSALVTAPVVEAVSHVLQSRDVHRNQTALVWPDPTGTKSLVSRSAEPPPHDVEGRGEKMHATMTGASRTIPRQHQVPPRTVGPVTSTRYVQPGAYEQ